MYLQIIQKKVAKCVQLLYSGVHFMSCGSFINKCVKFDINLI